MAQRSGDTSGGRRPRGPAILLLVALLAGCGSGGSDGDGAGAEVEPTATTAEEGAAGAGGSTMTTGSTTTTSPPTTLPEGSVKVPLDEELLARLPQIEGGGRDVVEDEAFDDRFCDGTPAPAVPEGQARASYPISPTDELTVAAYRFALGEAPAYLAGYAEAVRGCALEVGESAGLGVPEVFGSAFELRTERGDAFIAMALYDDVMWVLFQQSTEGPVEVDEATLEGFLQTVLG